MKEKSCSVLHILTERPAFSYHRRERILSDGEKMPNGCSSLPNDCYNRSVRAPVADKANTLGGRGGPIDPGWSMPSIGINACFRDCDWIFRIASRFDRLGTVMKSRSLFSLTAAAILVASVSSSAIAQDSIASPSDVGAKGFDRLELFDTLETTSGAPIGYPAKRSLSLAQLKQSRAIDRANARAARIEYNAWIGYDPLRPSWSSTPMTSSRYAPTILYVPVYRYGR